MVRLGVGPRPVQRTKLDASSLAKAVEAAVTKQEMAGHAKRLAVAIKGEEGIEVAVLTIERVLADERQA